MNKKLGMAVAGAVMAFGASAANAGITIPAGDWTIDIGGNVNAYYSNTRFDGILDNDVDGAPGGENANTISTGLLPAALGIGGKTRQNDLDIAFQFTFFTGVDSGGDSADANGGSGGSNSLNIRQAYMTFGDASWGTIKAGRDLGIFGSDAILSDMTLLGVGIGAGAGGTSTLGRIGSGYMYADWVGQISYHSPNWNGFSFAVGVREPWTNSADTGEITDRMGFEGKASYEWAGDMAGKVWVGYITQKHEYGYGMDDANGYRSDAWEVGAKVSPLPGLSLVGYYYEGDGISGSTDGLNGSTLGADIGVLNGLMFRAGKETEDDGGYVQATYAIPGIGTKIGLSYGVSNSKDDKGPFQYDFENKSWMVGVYHPLTKSLNLVAEYVDNDRENKIDSFSSYKLDGEAKTISLGAIMFF